MNIILLTQDNTFIIGQVAWILGKIMNGIFSLLSIIGLPSIGLSIIIFTIVVNLLMLPLTIKTQKFSKLSNKMQPEIQAIQNKYKNKKDNDSMIAQNQEIQAVYAKYGVSSAGGCVQLLIQMPILFALYSVIRSVPAYVGKIREAFFPLVDGLIRTEGGIELVKNFPNSAMYASRFNSSEFLNGNQTVMQNALIDCLNKASTTDFRSISENFPALKGDVNFTLQQLNVYNNFLGLNIGDSPKYIMSYAFNIGAWGLLIGALMIPLLSFLTQVISVKLMPQPNTNSNDDYGMGSSMKAMNMFMPFMSAYFCFTLPSGMGLYWISGSVVRTILMIIINKRIDKMDFDKLIEQNKEKSQKKLEKMQKQQELMASYANMNTKNISSKASYNNAANSFDSAKNTNKESASKNNNSAGSKSSSGSSMKDKANMVKNYNEKNNK